MVKKYDKEDPLEMKVMEIPGGNIERQALVMAEEFRDMGTTKKELTLMFSNPYYAGLYMAYVQLGKENIENIICHVYNSINTINRSQNEQSI
jgi:hypothetical protein